MIIARARAGEVYECLEGIWRKREKIRQTLHNFDPSIGDHAKRRDCDALWKRLRDLMLEDIARLEAACPRAVPDSDE